MPRFIHYDDRDWRLTELARAYQLAPTTLYRRLERFGESASGIVRALTTGIISREAAGRLGAARSPWRYQGLGHASSPFGSPSR
ncbi:MAG: hypothetical protein MUC53_00020 [Candidatus Contendobacter sp.]|jgi:hypothetical protein|nr:hypothetical protein [Candidatus Contendobacter sp.]